MFLTGGRDYIVTRKKKKKKKSYLFDCVQVPDGYVKCLNIKAVNGKV